MNTSQRILASDESLSPDVLRFCVHHNLLPRLQQALQLADAVWQPVIPMSVELDVDPETSDEWLVILVPVVGSTGDVVRREHEFTRRWVHIAPFEEREKIRVLFNVVPP